MIKTKFEYAGGKSLKDVLSKQVAEIKERTFNERIQKDLKHLMQDIEKEKGEIHIKLTADNKSIIDVRGYSPELKKKIQQVLNRIKIQ